MRSDADGNGSGNKMLPPNWIPGCTGRRYLSGNPTFCPVRWWKELLRANVAVMGDRICVGVYAV